MLFYTDNRKLKMDVIRMISRIKQSPSRRISSIILLGSAWIIGIYVTPELNNTQALSNNPETIHTPGLKAYRDVNGQITAHANEPTQAAALHTTSKVPPSPPELLDNPNGGKMMVLGKAFRASMQAHIPPPLASNHHNHAGHQHARAVCNLTIAAQNTRTQHTMTD